MKDKLVEQIGNELKLATRLDLVTVVVGTGLILVFFGIAMGFAADTVGSIASSLTGGLGRASASFNTMPTIIMFVMVLAIVAIGWSGVTMLMNNRKQRAKLNEGLAKLYKDEGFDQYSDGAIYTSYETRYTLFTVILGVTAAIGVIVPLTIFINNLTKL
jgi:hypothetical protein